MKKSPTPIRWNGEEIRNPVIRIALVSIVSLIVILTLPVLLPIHLVLRAFNKRGFYFKTGPLAYTLMEFKGALQDH